MHNRNQTSRCPLLNRIRTAFCSVVLVVLMMGLPMTALAAEQTDYSVVSEVKDLLEQFHIRNVKGSDLEEAAIEGMIQSLNDPYTEYMSKHEWDSYQRSVERQYVGIGIRLSEDEAGVYAAEVFPHSPAGEAGVVSGDYIVAVNGVPTEGKSTQEIVEMIVGEEFSEVEVTFLSRGEKRTLTMTRRSIQIPVVSGEMLAGGYGYIKIDTFSSGADKAFTDKLEELVEQGLNGLVVDVRNNPGGYVDTVSNIAAHFIEEGILMHTRDKQGKDDPVKIKRGSEVAFPVVILVNELSASGSEVFAGAMQDYKKAVVVGTQTYGKGSVQSIIPLQNGGVLKTTVQQYLTPNGRQVDGIGIVPDVTVSEALPQLITAFRKVGMEDITIRTQTNGVLFQDVHFRHPLPYIEREGRIYVHSRVLAALSDLHVSWDRSSQQVMMSSDEIELAYGTHTQEVIQENGRTYIHLSDFTQKVNGFAWTTEAGELILTMQAAK